MPHVLSPRHLVFRPDKGHKLYHHHLILKWFSVVKFSDEKLHILLSFAQSIDLVCTLELAH